MQFFWFWNPPSILIPLTDWLSFRSAIWVWLIAVSIAAVVLLVALYSWRIRQFSIRYPADPFRVPSVLWWLGWPLWALAPAAGMTIVYVTSFEDRFGTDFNPLWGAFTAGAVCWLLVLLGFQLLIWFPMITPKKFFYHPRWPWRLRRPSRRFPVVPTRS